MCASVLILFSVIGLSVAHAAPALDAQTSVPSKQLGRSIAQEREVSHVVKNSSGSFSMDNNCNANFCFAIDGSNVLSRSEFLYQKAFVKDLVSIHTFGRKMELSAVQYSDKGAVIAPLTSATEKFMKLVNSAQRQGGPSFVGAGIDACYNILKSRHDKKNKLVLIADGRTQATDDEVSSADALRAMGGEVWVLAVGFKDKERVLKIAGGDSNKVRYFGNMGDVGALAALDFEGALCP